MRSHSDIRNGQPLPNKVRPFQQNGIKILQDLLNCDLRGINILLIVGIATKDRAKPAAESRENLSVGEGTPLEDLSGGLGVFREERCIRVLGSD
jgi:hypothetical protein